MSELCTTRQEAYLAGRQARRDGRPQSDNPYTFDMSSTLLWLAEGWEEGWGDADAMVRSLEA